MNTVRISYRVVSSVVATTFVMVFAVELLFDNPHVPRSASVPEIGAFQIDPCTMWEQIPATVRLSTIISLVTTLILLVQGLRNRSVPRWLAILCLVALVPTINHEYWQRQECYSKLSATLLWICILATGLMCLHQIIWRQPMKKAAQASRPREKEE
jgi:uncharacterized membrane protein YhaH (DUF805 family)